MAQSSVEGWRDRGSTFSWAPASGGAPAVDVFHVELGDPEAPPVVLVHGWPTCSIDWEAVARDLGTDHRVCALDFPGYGFSDKPRGWGYSLGRDEELLAFYLAEIVRHDGATVVAHDRGDSVALLHALRCVEGRAQTRLGHLVLTNGNIFLPMSQLTSVQRRILDPTTGPPLVAQMTPELLAAGMGQTTFSPPRGGDDPEIRSLEATFAHADGIAVLHETIQYLVERAHHEQTWLAGAARATFPVTLVWGLEDTVSPPRVASHVWHEYLSRSPHGNRLYLLPGANHYLQVDRPAAFSRVVRDTLAADPAQALGLLDPEPGGPVLVDVSRPDLPLAADLLPPPAEGHAP